jgi:uncharacterized damage-inducible protein DinB
MLFGEEIMKHIALAATLLMAVTSGWSQQMKDSSAPVSNPVVTSVQQMEQRFSKNLTGAAETMPADKYSYKPTPDQMSFAHLMIHVAESNNGLCTALAGEKREVKLSESDSKDTLAGAVKDSFAYCQQVLAKADDSNLSQSVTTGGGQTTTRASALIHLIAGWADHYSAAAMYLRLNNLLPPSAAKADHK